MTENSNFAENNIEHFIRMASEFEYGSGIIVNVDDYVCIDREYNILTFTESELPHEFVGELILLRGCRFIKKL